MDNKTISILTGKRQVTIWSPFFHEIAINKYLYLLTIPGIIFFFIFAYLPMLGIVIAFQDFNPIKGIFGSSFVGFRNFKFLLTSDDFRLILVNTLYLNVLFITTGLIAQIAFSIMISEVSGRIFKKTTQTMLLLPYFLSWTVVSMFSVALFSTDEGFINYILSIFGIVPINYYQEAGVWPVLLIIFKLWKGLGWGTVLYLATISGIDHEIYEAAEIDGASRIQRILRITVPMLKTTTLILLIMSVGGIFYGDFGMIYTLVGDNPMVRSTTDVIDTYVYRALRVNIDIGRSSAVGFFQSTFGFIMVLLANTIVKKVEKDSALF